MMQQWWDEPTAGEIVWCHFPMTSTHARSHGQR